MSVRTSLLSDPSRDSPASGLQKPIADPPRRSRVPDHAESDERLVARVRAGDEVAFATIAERYGPLLLSLSRRIVGDDAQDAVQHALISAWGALRRGDDVRDLRPWLSTIAHRAALQTLRARGERAVELPASLAGGPSPAEHFERRDRTHSILSAIAQLPAAEQDALVSTSVHGRSGRDAATALGVSEGTVRQLVFRARTRVRAAAHVFVPPVPILRALAKCSHGARRIAGPGNGAAGLASSSEEIGLLVKVGAVLVVGVIVGAPVITPSRSHRPHGESRPVARGGGESVQPGLAARKSHGQRVPGTPVLVRDHSELAPVSRAGTAHSTTVPASPDGSTSATESPSSSARAGSTGHPSSTTPGVGQGQETNEAEGHNRPAASQVLPTVPQPVQSVGQTAQETQGALSKTGEAVSQAVQEVPGSVSQVVQELPASPSTGAVDVHSIAHLP